MKKTFIANVFAIIAIAIAMSVGVTAVRAQEATPVVPRSNNSWIVMQPKISPYNYYVDVNSDNVVMHFLTSYRTEGYAMIIDADTGIEQLFSEGEVHTFHSVMAYLPAGNYEVHAVAYVPFYNTPMVGKVITFEVK